MDNNILEALNAIPASELSRADWLSVGMALKDAGADCSVWDEWSRADSRYHNGECSKLWNGFNGSGITAATIIKMAQDRGWHQTPIGRNLDWNDTIEKDYDEFYPKPMSAKEMLIKFLQALYTSEDKIDIVTNEAFPDADGKWKPKAGHTMVVSQILENLNHYTGADAIENSIGTSHPEAGAWVRINPIDGNGHGNSNVIAYKYALVESDTLSKEDQKAKLRELQLPIATMVDSGGKSIHALVRVEASNAAEYKQRVNYLYDYLTKNGYDIDRQNNNEGRLSRLPGVMRNGQMQALLGTDLGMATWSAWEAWSKGETIELPQILSFKHYIDHPPVLRPELIHGILRQNHKLMLQGPSKAGKSFAMMELCAALATGTPWMGWQCEKTRAIYLNMELDDQSCGKRFVDIQNAWGLNPNELGENLFIWNLRGKQVNLDTMMADILHMMRDYKPGMVCIDPIYKLLQGDENNASDMAHFVGQFDKISTDLGTSIAISHHYAKGSAGQKDSKDRSSGSGVFARDPDAIIDLAPLVVTDAFLINQGGTLNGKKPFRISTTLREFADSDPVNVWFAAPRHLLDTEGELKGLRIEGEPLSNEVRSADAKTIRDNKLWTAYCNADSHSVEDIAKFMNIGRSAVYNKVKASEGDYIIYNGELYTKEDAPQGALSRD